MSKTQSELTESHPWRWLAHCTELFALLPQAFGGLWANLPRISHVALWWVLALGYGAQAQEPSPEDTSQAESAKEAVAEPKEPEEPPLYQSREQRDMTLLSKRLDPSSLVWQEVEGRQFLSLYEQELTGDAVGAVLILNAEGQHSSWPTTVERIRSSLPEYGWNTLSSELPAPDGLSIPERTLPVRPLSPATTTEGADEQTDPADKAQEADKQEPQSVDASDADTGAAGAVAPADTEAPEPPKITAEEMAHLRIRSAFEYLHERGQFNVAVIGAGVGAVRAACYSRDLPQRVAGQPRLIRAMVFINARNQIEGTDMNLTDCLQDPELPVLDVYLGDTRRDQLEANRRLKHSRRLKMRNYQQLRLPQMASNTMLGENRLARRVRGFLEHNAKGIKIDNAIIRQPP
jgi:hypothetical protein